MPAVRKGQNVLAYAIPNCRIGSINHLCRQHRVNREGKQYSFPDYIRTARHARYAFASKEDRFLPSGLVQNIDAQMTAGRIVARRARPHRSLDFKRRVPFLELLMLK